MIKTLVFDLGGVVILQNEMIMSEFISKIFDIPLTDAVRFTQIYIDDLQIGRVTSKDMLLHGKRKFTSAKNLLSLQNEWLELYRKKLIGLNQELIHMIKKLKEKLNVYALTNTIDTHAFYFGSLDISQHFIRIYKSFEVGMKKPDKDIYLYLLKEIKNRANEVVFIDDLEENVKVADSIGMKGIVYKNVKQLREDLKKFGVKI